MGRRCVSSSLHRRARVNHRVSSTVRARDVWKGVHRGRCAFGSSVILVWGFGLVTSGAWRGVKATKVLKVPTPHLYSTLRTTLLLLMAILKGVTGRVSQRYEVLHYMTVDSSAHKQVVAHHQHGAQTHAATVSRVDMGIGTASQQCIARGGEEQNRSNSVGHRKGPALRAW
jgi:hypothetical protein